MHPPPSLLRLHCQLPLRFNVIRLEPQSFLYLRNGLVAPAEFGQSDVKIQPCLRIFWIELDRSFKCLGGFVGFIERSKTIAEVGVGGGVLRVDADSVAKVWQCFGD